MIIINMIFERTMFDRFKRQIKAYIETPFLKCVNFFKHFYNTLFKLLISDIGVTTIRLDTYSVFRDCSGEKLA
jgi:hypothetical protein